MTLLVGPSETSFFVHKNLICDASSFFQTAFDSNFVEGLDQSMKLPEDDPSIVEVFIECLYARVYTQEITISVEIHMSDEQLVSHLLTVFFFAEKYEIKPLKKRALDDLVQTLINGKVLKQLHFVHIYESTSPASGLRKLAQDYFVWFGDLSALCEKETVRPWLMKYPEIATDLFFRFARFIDEGSIGKSRQKLRALRASNYYETV